MMEKFLELEYRGEGNCAIVFATPQTNQVYRLVKNNATRKMRKQLQKYLDSEAQDSKNIQNAVKKELDNVVTYVNNIIRPLLTDLYVVTPSITSIPQGLGEKAIAFAEQARPAHRKHSKSDAVDSDIQYALVLPDCCFVCQRERNSSNLLEDLGHRKTDESFDSVACSDSEGIFTERQLFSRSYSGDSDPDSDNLDSNTSFTDGNAEDSDSCSHISQPVDYIVDIDESEKSVPHICCSFDRISSENMPCDRENYYSKGKDYFEKEDLLDCGLKPEISQINSNFTLSIEIKPKKAFMTKSAIDSDLPQNSKVCRFCMHQHLKRKSGKWPQTSSYCPLDLFSGNKHRMKHALISLIKTPQNNLKICKNGKEVYGSDIRKDLGAILQDWFPVNSRRQQMLISVFLDLVIEILLHSVGYDSEVAEGHTSMSLTERCDSSSFVHTDEDLSQRLPRGCVLERIYSLQSLDDLDIEGVVPLYKKLSQELDQNPCLGNKWCLNGPYDNLSWLFGSPGKQLKDLAPDSDDYAVLKIKRFLVSKTLQDCSIIVAIKPVLESVHDERNFLRFEGDLYNFSINVVDLDPKPFEKVKTYYRQATDIVETFAESSYKMSSQCETKT